MHFWLSMLYIEMFAFGDQSQRKHMVAEDIEKVIKPKHGQGFLLCVCLSVCVSVSKISEKSIELINFIFGGGLPSDPGRETI